MKAWADPEGGPPEKSQKYRVSLQYWYGSPEKSQNYQISIQCWAIICPQRNAISMAFHWWAHDGPFIAVCESSLPSLKKQNKKSYQIWTTLTKLSGWAHGRNNKSNIRKSKSWSKNTFCRCVIFKHLECTFSQMHRFVATLDFSS